MTIAQIRKDKRVESFTKLDKEEFSDANWELVLAEGYEFSDGSSIQYLETVKEASNELDDVRACK